MDPMRLTLREAFEPPEGPDTSDEIDSIRFRRSVSSVANQGFLKLDRFPDAAGAACCFVHLVPRGGQTVGFALEGVYGITRCRSGGWLLRPTEPNHPGYWIPKAPIYRRRDGNGRIIYEEPASPAGFSPASERSTIDFDVLPDAALECALWRFPCEASEFIDALEQPLAIERQSVFMLASHTSLLGPADVYTYLLHGHVYENRFDPINKRKICTELEAYAIYLALEGLESATGKRLYGLLKRQIVFSVIARQSEDGGWRHGEWTDLMESHYRFHNAAMLLLEAAFEEAPDDAIAEALRRAASVLSRCTDKTDIGVWFFHDSQEQSVEITNASGIRWIPGRELGKSPATKMILNTHLDAIVTLTRYREVSGDSQYDVLVASALGATRTLLALRPAEWLYRMLYRAVGLTLLPEAEARKLPIVLRAIKRLTRIYLLPQLYRVKRRFPRMVMPGGLIERHLSRPHFSVNYHSVTLADLVRLWRRFPGEDLGDVVAGAIAAVTQSGLLRYWIDLRQRQALGYWVEALFHLCTLRGEPAFRRYLADAILAAVDVGLGLPPSLLGAHPEVVKRSERFPCPSPLDPHLRIANLSCGGRPEILVVNPTSEAIELAFENNRERGFAWATADVPLNAAANSGLSVPPRGWLLGRGA